MAKRTNKFRFASLFETSGRHTHTSHTITISISTSDYTTQNQNRFIDGDCWTLCSDAGVDECIVIVVIFFVFVSVPI